MTDPLDPRLPPAPVAHTYAPAEPWDRGPQHDRSRLTIGWVLFGLSLPVSAVVCTYSLLLSLWSLMAPGWYTVALVGIPLALIAATVVLLVQLIRRRPSLVLGSVLLGVGVLAFLGGRAWIYG